MTQIAVGDPVRYHGMTGRVVGLGRVLEPAEPAPRWAPVVDFEWQLSVAAAVALPKVSLVPAVGDDGAPVLDATTGKPVLAKFEEPWPAEDPRFACTRAFVSDMRWDTGYKAWVVDGHGVEVVREKPGTDDDGQPTVLRRKVFYPDASHPENLKTERED